MREKLIQEEEKQDKARNSPKKKKRTEKNDKNHQDPERGGAEDEGSSSDSEGLSAEVSPRYHIPRVSSKDLKFPQWDEEEWYASAISC